MELKHYNYLFSHFDAWEKEFASEDSKVDNPGYMDKYPAQSNCMVLSHHGQSQFSHDGGKLSEWVINLIRFPYSFVITC